NSEIYGQPVVFTAVVAATSPGAGTPTGTVVLKNGATAVATNSLISGQVSFTNSVLTAGSHSITALYSGDSSFNTNTSSALSQTVNKAILTVTADNQSRLYGDANSTFTASYSGFKNGETLATSGVTGAPSLTTSATAG